eukprot:316044-Pelagomonas_calceolata.AAC.1
MDTHTHTQTTHTHGHTHTHLWLDGRAVGLVLQRLQQRMQELLAVLLGAIPPAGVQPCHAVHELGGADHSTLQ